MLRNFLAWCCVRAGCFLSHNAPPITCSLELRLFRFVFDFVFWLKFVCSGGSLDYLVSAAALILFDQESPSPLTCLNFFVAFITEILDFSCSLGESPPSALRLASFAAKNLESLPHLRDDLHERLKRSARMQFGALSLLKVESTVCFQRKRRRERA